MRRIIALTILSIPFFVSCIFDNGEFGSSLSGIVTDSVTGISIESALVYAGDTASEYPVATDSAGKYTWADFGYGPSIVFVKKEGYKTVSRTFSKWRGEKKGVDFRLVPE